MIVAIYAALAALSFWGATAWDSYFMWFMGVGWTIMAVLIAAWFINRMPDMPDDEDDW